MKPTRTKFMVIALALLPAVTHGEVLEAGSSSDSGWINPLRWFSTKINLDSEYTLVFLDNSRPNRQVLIKERLEGYRLRVADVQSSEVSTVSCEDLQNIFEFKPAATTARVGLGSVIAAAAITLFSSGILAPVAAGILGGRSAYTSRGMTPTEFCIK